MPEACVELPPILALDAQREAERITVKLRTCLRSQLKRKGWVVGISGGVDSAVCAALAVKAIGSKQVLGLLMPEQHTSPSALKQGLEVVEHLGIDHKTVDITETLTALGCYKLQNEAIRQVVPDFESHWKYKLVLSGGLEGGINHTQLVVQPPTGAQQRYFLPRSPYLQLIAATNFKQRLRKMLEYYHAEKQYYAVIGTPNRLEYDQGFFVKGGDGLADCKPIAHLYKTQVYRLAQYLQLPQSVCTATPSTDTFSLSQGQDEFYFGLPYWQMDWALWAFNHGLPSSRVADYLKKPIEFADQVYKDIQHKRRNAEYLHARPYTLESSGAGEVF